MWPDPDELVVSSERGPYVNEVLIPFVRTESGIPLGSSSRPVSSPARRSFAPGSEWLYLKIYTGTAVADSLLRETIGPLVASARSAGAVDRWFFIRYADPGPHLRVRLHGDPDRLTAQVLRAFRRALEPDLEGRVWRFEVGTYDREIERYGGPDAIETAEAVFEADSDAVLAMVSGGGTLDDRWRAALAGLHRLFVDLGLDDEAQARVARRMRDGYAAELGADSLLKRQIGDRYRAERRSLEPLIDADATAEGALGRALDVLKRRSDALRAPVERLHELGAAGRLTTPVEDFAASLGHMHVNRLIRSSQRAHEMVIYDLLDRLYMTRAARRRARP
jgi:thiopeptide-type bacteriocin biosynthesis protein